MDKSNNSCKVCKNYLEIKTIEKYIFFLKIFMSAYQRPFGYWDASIWHYEDQHEWAKTLSNGDWL